VQTLLQRLERASQPTPSGNPLLIDAKPLPVGDHTKDRDARNGYATGMLAYGYKLHVICDLNRHVHAWTVAPMNRAESLVAVDLLRDADVRDGWLLADSAHDSNELHAFTDQRGLQLIAPRKKPGRGLGHREHSAGRLRSIAIMEADDSPLPEEVARQRDAIERYFGNLTSFGGGLSPLPAWVRTLPRVRRRVQARITIHALRRRLRIQQCA